MMDGYDTALMAAFFLLMLSVIFADGDKTRDAIELHCGDVAHEAVKP